jgi:calcineurin-like phosphoesterase family protein
LDAAAHADNFGAAADSRLNGAAILVGSMGKLLGFVPFSPRRAAPLVALLTMVWSGLVGVPPAKALDPVLVAAGDIAGCGHLGDTATAALVASTVGTVATIGDHAYNHGTAAQFANCYGPTWGRFKGRTRPAIGNHEYRTPGAAGYFNYFANQAGPRGKGWYSYNLGSWHVIVLNSNCSQVACGKGSEQERWLRADLAAHANKCTLAYWHHPRFSSDNRHGNWPTVGPFWDALYEHGADLVLAGHAHVYERFAPLTPWGTADASFGIRQFTVGTGGNGLYGFRGVKPNSQVRNANTLGVLKLILRSEGYDWRFLPQAGKTFTDAGTAACHGRPSPTSVTSPSSTTTTTKPAGAPSPSTTTTWPVAPSSTSTTTRPRPSTTTTTRGSYYG